MKMKNFRIPLPMAAHEAARMVPGEVTYFHPGKDVTRSNIVLAPDEAAAVREMTLEDKLTTAVRIVLRQAIKDWREKKAGKESGKNDR